MPMFANMAIMAYFPVVAQCAPSAKSPRRRNPPAGKITPAGAPPRLVGPGPRQVVSFGWSRSKVPGPAIPICRIKQL